MRQTVQLANTDFRDAERADPVPVMCRSQNIIAPKYVNRVEYAINKTGKEVGLE